MQPRQLMQGNPVMKATGPNERRWVPGGAICISGGFYDPFEEGQERPYLRTRLKLCMNCHGGRGGLGSVMTDSIRLSSRRPFLTEGALEVISRATSEQKRGDNTWKVLFALWQMDSKKQAARETESGQ